MRDSRVPVLQEQQHSEGLLIALWVFDVWCISWPSSTAEPCKGFHPPLTAFQTSLPGFLGHIRGPSHPKIVLDSKLPSGLYRAFWT